MLTSPGIHAIFFGIFFTHIYNPDYQSTHLNQIHGLMHVHSLMNVMRVGGVLWHQRVLGLVCRLEEFGREFVLMIPTTTIHWTFYLKSCSHQHVVQQVQVWPRRPQVVGGRMVGVHPEAQILLLKKKDLTFDF